MKKLQDWHRTRLGYIVFAVVEAAGFYGAASLSIDRGSLWYYILAIILLVGTLQNLVKLIGTFFHGKRKPSEA